MRRLKWRRLITAFFALLTLVSLCSCLLLVTILAAFVEEVRECGNFGTGPGYAENLLYTTRRYSTQLAGRVEDMAHQPIADARILLTVEQVDAYCTNQKVVEAYRMVSNHAGSFGLPEPVTIGWQGQEVHPWGTLTSVVVLKVLVPDCNGQPAHMRRFSDTRYDHLPSNKLDHTFEDLLIQLRCKAPDF